MRLIFILLDVLIKRAIALLTNAIKMREFRVFGFHSKWHNNEYILLLFFFANR